MGYRHGIPPKDLLLKYGDRRTGTPDDVSETHGHEAGCRPPVHTFHEHFPHPFGRPHRIRGANRLVRRDEDEPLHAPFRRLFNQIPRPPYVVIHRFPRIQLLDGDVLIGGCMEYHVRGTLPEYL